MRRVAVLCVVVVAAFTLGPAATVARAGPGDPVAGWEPEAVEAGRYYDPLLALPGGGTYVALAESALAKVRPDGTLDRAFGLVPIDFALFAYALDGDRFVGVSQRDGELKVFRIRSDGSNDPFGTQTAVTIVSDRYSAEVGVDARHRIVLAVDRDVIRLDPDGDRDESFGGGRVVVPEPVRAMAVGADGAVIVASGDTPDAAVLVRRLMPDGSPDAAFGNGGVADASPPPGHGHVIVSRVLLDTTGDVVVVGTTTFPGSFDTGWYVARLTRDGVVRAVRGTVTMSCRESFNDADIDAAGNLYLSGTVSTLFGRQQGVVARLTPDLVLDPSFGAAGLVPVPASTALSVVPQPEQGRVLVGLLDDLGRSIAIRRPLALDAGSGPRRPDVSGADYDQVLRDPSVGDTQVRLVAVAGTSLCHRFGVTADGAVYGRGMASPYGDLRGRRLAKPVVGIAATPSGRGYWLVAADGGVFSFGDAGFHGSMGGRRLARPVVGIAARPSGRGYWLVAADGGVFSFGDAGFHGSVATMPIRRPVVSIAATPSGSGYWLAAEDGGVFTYGDAPFRRAGCECTSYIALLPI